MSGLGKQFRDPDVQFLAQLQQLVIGQRQAVVLDLRQRRDRNSAALAHLLQGPAAVAAKLAQDASEGRVSSHFRHLADSIDNSLIRTIMSPIGL